jgi:5'-nucleotidase
VRQLEAASKQKNTVTVAAGDLIGATPLLSAAFHDEPAIEALNLIGLDYASVGNHEFDEGPAELLRIQNGGCHPSTAAADPALPYQGADFQYLSANAFVTATGQPLLAAVRDPQGAGRQGRLHRHDARGNAQHRDAVRRRGLEFRDEAETANRYAAELQRQGVEAIVVLLHEGGVQASGSGINDCKGLTGPITQIVPQMVDAIDVVITGHTHQAYNCEVDGRIVTSASSAGRLVTDIDLQIDRHRRRRTATATTCRSSARCGGRRADRAIAATATQLGPSRRRVVGTATTASHAARLRGGPLGNLIADAQLADPRQAPSPALMKPRGVAPSSTRAITYEEAFSVQPFGNLLTTITLTGAQLDCVLEQQFAGGRKRRLQPSASLGYTRDRSQPAGTATPPCSGQQVTDLRIDGTLVDPAASYRITVNNFLADGGDGFTQLTGGTARTLGVDDLTALTDYLTTQGTVSAPATNRIRLLP